MNSAPKLSDKNTKPAVHEAGAYAAWGLLGGVALGAFAGWLAHHAIVGALVLGTAGWFAGALFERAKR